MFCTVVFNANGYHQSVELFYMISKACPDSFRLSDSILISVALLRFSFRSTSYFHARRLHLPATLAELPVPGCFFFFLPFCVNSSERCPWESQEISSFGLSRTTMSRSKSLRSHWLLPPPPWDPLCTCICTRLSDWIRARKSRGIGVPVNSGWWV